MRLSRSLLGLCSSTALLLSACFSPSLSGPGGFTCAKTNECPPDFVCNAQKVCVRPGAEFDSGTGVKDEGTGAKDTASGPDRTVSPGDQSSHADMAAPALTCSEDTSFAVGVKSTLALLGGTAKILGVQYGVSLDTSDAAKQPVLHLGFVAEARQGRIVTTVWRTADQHGFTQMLVSAAPSAERIAIAHYTGANGLSRSAGVYDGSDPNASSGRQLYLLDNLTTTGPTFVDKGPVDANHLAIAAKGPNDYGIAYQVSNGTQAGTRYARFTGTKASTPVQIPPPVGFTASGYHNKLVYRPTIGGATESYLLFQVTRKDPLSGVYVTPISLANNSFTDPTAIRSQRQRVAPEDDGLSLAIGDSKAGGARAYLVFPDNNNQTELGLFLQPFTQGGVPQKQQPVQLSGAAPTKARQPSIAASGLRQGLLALNESNELLFSARADDAAVWLAPISLGKMISASQPEIVAHTTGAGETIFDIFYRINDDLQQRRMVCKP